MLFLSFKDVLEEISSNFFDAINKQNGSWIKGV